MNNVCSACLSNGRVLHSIENTIYSKFYIQFVYESSSVNASEICLRICWECKALLRKFEIFKQKAQSAFKFLTEGLDSLNINPFLLQSQLQIYRLHNYDYSDDVKHEDIIQEADLEVKIEPVEHDEPETFVNDFVVDEEARPAELKTKKKIKEKKNKVRKKKTKLKRKRPRSPSVNTDSVDCQAGLTDAGSDGEPLVANNEDSNKETAARSAASQGQVRGPGGAAGQGQVRRPEGRRGPVCSLGAGDRPQCAECGKMFSTAKTHRRHIDVVHRGHNKFPCPHCERVYRWNSNLHRHIRSHKAREADELYCVTCDKRYSSIATFRQHLTGSKMHVPVEQFMFVCGECGKRFVSKTNLKDHIDWEHLKRVKFRCKVCDKPFKTHTSLYLHMQNVHTHESRKKSNLCHVCGKRYQNSAKLKSHITALHTSHTPYRCGKCSAAFSWHSSLYRHLKEIHHKIKAPYGVKKTKKSPQVLPAPPPAPAADT
ncbi:zinc finger protein 773 isoform X1 [Bombyx mori]|uniref:C2H2-type domain-containing protein n=1 Tax=Bombyx mori TaxID=7091 RepID=A0A8R2LY00_BOMMO|nr:zinc finger protein 773 isoform X1 [Bombyx mori]